MRALFKCGSIYVAACIALAGCSSSGGPEGGDSSKADGPTTVVEVLPGGEMCAVKATEIRCDEVASHLRDVLMVKSDEYIAVEVDTSHAPIPFDSMTKVIDSLKKGGFTLVVGSVPISKSGPT